MTDTLTPLQKAALTIQQLRAQIDSLKQAQQEPIAIIGMSGRFPGANHLDDYWQLLIQGVNAVTEVPPDRWSLDEFYDPNPNRPGKINVRHGGFIRDVDQFDARFFGIAPQEATKLDPQHRLLLEMVWEALEHAGQAPDRLLGSQTGTFIGINQMDYSLWQVGGDPSEFDVYSSTSHGFCFAAGRIAYTLGITGPCMPIDTACSSSLVAVHLASQSLRNRECQLAIAGGVQLNLSPEFHLLMTKTQSLSPSGACKTFDAAADGYVLGEGCGIVILKRLSDAIRDRDHIYAVLRASAVKHSGATSGITVPSELTEAELVRSVLQQAAVHPDTVDYIETHGTGTTLGDPIEIGALSSVFRGRNTPLTLGAVKTNIGHLDAAAGVAGLIKTVLALENEMIPPNLHFNTPSPHIDWEKCPLKIPTTPQSWPRQHERPRLAGVSSFAIMGTMAHVLLQEAPKSEIQKIDRTAERPSHLLALSAKNADALMALSQRYFNFLQAHSQDIGDICFTANTGRAHFKHRVIFHGKTHDDFIQSLAAYLKQLPHVHYQHGEVKNAPKIIYHFSELSINYIEINSLFRSEVAFKTALMAGESAWLKNHPHSIIYRGK
jgi:acyl transferase domain-containing protein